MVDPNPHETPTDSSSEDDEISPPPPSIASDEEEVSEFEDPVGEDEGSTDEDSHIRLRDGSTDLLQALLFQTTADMGCGYRDAKSDRLTGDTDKDQDKAKRDVTNIGHSSTTEMREESEISLTPARYSLRKLPSSPPTPVTVPAPSRGKVGKAKGKISKETRVSSELEGVTVGILKDTMITVLDGTIKLKNELAQYMRVNENAEEADEMHEEIRRKFNKAGGYRCRSPGHVRKKREERKREVDNDGRKSQSTDQDSAAEKGKTAENETVAKQAEKAEVAEKEKAKAAEKAELAAQVKWAQASERAKAARKAKNAEKAKAAEQTKSVEITKTRELARFAERAKIAELAEMNQRRYQKIKGADKVNESRKRDRSLGGKGEESGMKRARPLDK